MISALFIASLISGFNKDATHTFPVGKSPPVIHVTDLYDGYPISEILMGVSLVRDLDSIQYTIVVNNNTQADFQSYLFAYDISLKTFLGLHLTIGHKSVPFQLIQYNPFHEFQVYPIKLAAAKADTVIIKLLASKDFSVQMISKPEYIPDINSIISFEIKGNYFELWICGMLFMMALYVGANFFQIRNREYFYYLCYVVFIFFIFYS